MVWIQKFIQQYTQDLVQCCTYTLTEQIVANSNFSPIVSLFWYFELWSVVEQHVAVFPHIIIHITHRMILRSTIENKHIQRIFDLKALSFAQFKISMIWNIILFLLTNWSNCQQKATWKVYREHLTKRQHYRYHVVKASDRPDIGML